MSNIPLIRAAREAYEAQQAIYAQEEAERWAIFQSSLDNCAQEMAKREKAYAKTMGGP
jgi:hypothetical protein